MPPTSRVMAGLLVAAIVVSMGFLVQGGSSERMEYLFGGQLFSDMEMHKAEMAFSSAGLKEYERNGNRIQIPSGSKDIYVKALVDGNAFPKDLSAPISAALDSGNMFDSMEKQREKLKHGKSNALRLTLMQLGYVEDALVFYDEKTEGFVGDTLRTASVFIKPVYGHSLSADQKRNIARYVQSAYAGLPYENISILDTSTDSGFSGASDPLTSEEQMAYTMRRQVEEDYKRQVRNLLADYGDVRVEAHVELDATLRHATESIKYNDKPIAVQTNVARRDSENQRSSPSGRPGAEPNAGPNQAASLASANTNTSTSKNSEESEQRITGHEATLIEKAGLEVKQVSLSVLIPRSFYKKAFDRQWLELNPDSTDPPPAITPSDLTRIEEETRVKIENQLTPLLPPEPPGGDRFKRVSVQDYFDEAPIEFVEPSFSQTAIAWLAGSWQTIGMFGLALVALLFVRSVVKSTPIESADSDFKRGFDIPLDGVFDLDDDALQEDTDGNSETGSKPKLVTTGSTVKQDISEMVREDSDAAVNVLRKWISDAA